MQFSRDSPPPHHFCSDVDGMRFLLVDPDLADMSGWKISVNARNGKTHEVQFEIEQWFHHGGSWNGLGYGDLRDAWAVVVGHGESISAWVEPSS